MSALSLRQGVTAAVLKVSDPTSLVSEARQGATQKHPQVLSSSLLTLLLFLLLATKRIVEDVFISMSANLLVLSLILFEGLCVLLDMIKR